MNCSICKRAIVLVPSASERAKKYGGKPEDYTRLFTVHGACQVNLREDETLALMRRINNQVVLS